MAATIERIHPQKAYRYIRGNSETLLVCAYDSDEQFRQNRLAGSISLENFKSQADQLSLNQEIIFYCA